MSFLLKYWNKYWKYFCAALIWLVFEAICDLLQPTIVSKIVDVGIAEKDINYVIKMSSVMLLVTLAGAASAVARNIVSSNVSQRFGAELRFDLFKKVQTFSFENIDKFDQASLVTRMTNDVTQVQNFAHGLMRIFVKSPILCIGSIIMASLLNARLALILIVVVPVIAFIIFMSIRTGYPFFSKVQKFLDRVNGVMREYLSGVRVVKAFNRFNFEKERFEKVNDELSSVSISAMRVMTLFTPMITLTVNLSLVAVIWIGGFNVNSGSMKVGQIIAFINYMTQILNSLLMISHVFTIFVRARASAERINEVFNEEVKLTIAKQPVKINDTAGSIDFEHVYFKYPNNGDDYVLKDISFKCVPGETLGIIGSTGSGKSSLINLIPRFYDCDSGVVKLNGINVTDADPKKLREKIAVVPQKTILFTGTILENIKWGNESATAEEVENAARIACAHDFISAFPEKYNTLLGQNGVNLSGGQKQRISIARAIVRKPEILILDDSTSAVDVTTELKIKEALKIYSDKLTCIVIAQRITSVMSADRILVLDDGKIASLGTHNELMKSCDVYMDIFRSQIGREAAVHG